MAPVPATLVDDLKFAKSNLVGLSERVESLQRRLSEKFEPIEEAAQSVRETTRALAAMKSDGGAPSPGRPAVAPASGQTLALGGEGRGDGADSERGAERAGRAQVNPRAGSSVSGLPECAARRDACRNGVAGLRDEQVKAQSAL